MLSVVAPSFGRLALIARAGHEVARVLHGLARYREVFEVRIAAMFRGIANATLDAKGRMPLPARFREQVIDRCEGKVVLTVDIQSKCLLLYCVQDWDRLQREVHQLPNMSEQTRIMQRMMVGHANDLDLDSNGRLLVAQSLRDIAGLDKRAVVIGQTNKIEIWNETLWQSATEQWLSPEGRKALVSSDEFGSLSI